MDEVKHIIKFHPWWWGKAIIFREWSGDCVGVDMVLRNNKGKLKRLITLYYNAHGIIVEVTVEDLYADELFDRQRS